MDLQTAMHCTIGYGDLGLLKHKKVLKVDTHHIFIIFYINRDRVKRHKLKVRLWTIGEKTFERKLHTLAK